MEIAGSSAPAAAPRTLSVEVERLQALLGKYEQLVALRRGAGERTPDRRDAMRAVASRFPGALREWDALPLAELERRREVVREALAQAGRGGPPPALVDRREAWLALSLDVHAHLLSMMRLRGWLRRQPGPLEEILDSCQRFFDEGEPAWPEVLTQARLRRIAAPPGGRLSEIVYADVARRHDVTVPDLKRALFDSAPQLSHR